MSTKTCRCCCEQHSHSRAGFVRLSDLIESSEPPPTTTPAKRRNLSDILREAGESSPRDQAAAKAQPARRKNLSDILREAGLSGC